MDYDTIVTRPSLIGFLPRYVSSLLPIILYYVVFSKPFTEHLHVNQTVLYVSILVVMFVASYLTWNRPAFFSILDSVMFTVFFHYCGCPQVSGHILYYSVLAGSVTAFMTVVLYRHSIKYEIDVGGITIYSGFLKKRTVFIQPSSIKEVVLNRWPILDIGTITIITGAGIDIEESEHGAVGGGLKGKLFGGLFFSKTKKSEAKDPENTICCVRSASKIFRYISDISKFTTKVMLEQLRVLKSIDSKVG